MYSISKLRILVSMCMAVCLICSCDNREEVSVKGRALKNAVEFSGTESDIKELAQAFRRGTAPVKGVVWHSVGKDNLSSFLLTFGGDPELKLEQYEIQFDTSGGCFPENFLSEGKSIVSFANLADIKWPVGDHPGVFSFNGYGVSGKCYFTAAERKGGIAITKLAIARKKSTKLEDGILVFRKSE